MDQPPGSRRTQCRLTAVPAGLAATLVGGFPSPGLGLLICSDYNREPSFNATSSLKPSSLVMMHCSHFIDGETETGTTGWVPARPCLVDRQR